MPPFYELAVARFAQSPSKTKWAIAIIFTPSSGHSLIYQIAGTTADYSLGKVPLGLVDSEHLHLLHPTLAAIPIVRGNPAWSTRNWVTEGVQALRNLDGPPRDPNPRGSSATV